MKRRRRRRCPYCGELFWPDLRVKHRQRVCGKSECQRLRRVETQRRYRERTRGERAAEKYRQSVVREKEGVGKGIGPPEIIGEFPESLWEEMRDEIEPQLLVTLRFFADLLFQRREDERVVQRFVNTEEFVNLGIEEVKDQSDSAFSGP